MNMKRVGFVAVLLLSQLLSFSQYYWYMGEKVFLQEGSRRYVLFPSKRSSNLRSYQQTGETEDATIMWGIQDKSIPIANDAVYCSSSYIIGDEVEDEVYITARLYVKLRRLEDYAILQQLAEANHIKILRQASVPFWYILSCAGNTTTDAMQMANLFYESGLFAAAEPEFINTFKMSCTNDTYFNQQWNLLNTGQYGSTYAGIDINLCNAHTISKGDNSIVIAVFDQGVDCTHEDLNIYDLSYNTETQTSPSVIYGSHGTACAGIIGAKSNNNLGIAGIAPECPIMSISNSMTIPSNADELADGFMYAANNGASIISNSWFSTICSNMLTNAISYALNNGRNGKGCVVVFAAGNDNSSNVSYPANSNDSIVVVGAISPCGERKTPTSCDGETGWGSNYGNLLDVMAPGVKIPTTDIMGAVGYTSTNYYMYFNGTSSACPHVAAVAGLILSVNPHLTQKEVAHIIESTALKIGAYSYTSHADHPSGTWNNQMGYGLIDAYAAVMAAKDKYIQNKQYLNGSSVVESYPEIYAGYAVTNVVPYGDVIVKSGSNVTFKASRAIHLESGFSVEQGATFYAYIDPIAPPTTSSLAPATMRRNLPSFQSSLQSEHETNNVSIFPTPTHSLLHIRSTNELSLAQIFSLNGQCLLQTSQTDIDVSALPQGMYILSALTTDGQQHQAKFIKQ